MKVTVTGPVAKINQGKLKLAQGQAAARKHCLKSLGNDVYEIVLPVQFKHGEEFDYEGDGLDKALVHVLEVIQNEVVEEVAEVEEKIETPETKTSSKKGNKRK